MKKSIIAAIFALSSLIASAQNKSDKLTDVLIELSSVLNQQRSNPSTQSPSQKPSPQPRPQKAWFDNKSVLNVSMSNYFENSSTVAKYLIGSPFLTDVEKFIENTISLDQPLTIIFVDNQDIKNNAHFDPSCNCIRISYSVIKQNADKIMNNFQGRSYGEAIQGVTLQILFHEIGHYLVHNYQLNITGKEENAVDELSVMSMLFLANEKPVYYKSILNGILGWYDKTSNVSSRSMVDVHAPNRERYYDMLSLYLGSLGDRALGSDFVGNEDYQINRQRLYSSQREYQKAYNSWSELMARFL